MSEQTLSLEGLVFEAIELEIKDHIMTIRLNRPDRKNAINATMGAEIIYALDYAKQERSVRVVVLKAKGDVFCAGGDLAQMSGQGNKDKSTVPARGGNDDIALRFRHLNKPSIAFGFSTFHKAVRPDMLNHHCRCNRIVISIKACDFT